jgi:hypothetical protein
MKLSLPKLRTVLSQPVVGFAPWILLAVAEGPHRVALAAGLACALAVLTCAAGTIVGLRPKLLDITAITFFGALALTAMLASPAAGRWLGTWSGELSTAVIAAVAALSLAARRPFHAAVPAHQLRPHRGMGGRLPAHRDHRLPRGRPAAPARQQLDQLDHPDRARRPRREVHRLVPRPRHRRASGRRRAGAATRPSVPPAGRLLHRRRHHRAAHRRYAMAGRGRPHHHRPRSPARPPLLRRRPLSRGCAAARQHGHGRHPPAILTVRSG